MPIATCFVRGDVPDAELDGLAAIWAEEAGVGGEEMTINVVTGTRQSGKAYEAMAFLQLPSLWGAEDVRRLELGLARALARGLGTDPTGIQVITSLVESGLVVEGDEVVEW